MEWMSPIDSSFLHVENDATPMHIGGVSIFAGPPPPFDELKAMVEGKLTLVPRYRQKVRFVPLAVGPPAWVDDPHFSLSYHVRHAAVPVPGSDLQLRQMASRIFSQHLDRNKPLWDAHRRDRTGPAGPARPRRAGRAHAFELRQEPLRSPAGKGQGEPLSRDRLS